jgi:hypothetical protein
MNSRCKKTVFRFTSQTLSIPRLGIGHSPAAMRSAPATIGRTNRGSGPRQPLAGTGTREEQAIAGRGRRTIRRWPATVLVWMGARCENACEAPRRCPFLGRKAAPLWILGRWPDHQMPGGRAICFMANHLGQFVSSVVAEEVRSPVRAFLQNRAGRPAA